MPPHCISTSTTDQPIVAPPTQHLGQPWQAYSRHRVGSGSQRQRRLVDGVVDGRVRGGHGYHQPQLLNDDLQVAPPGFSPGTSVSLAEAGVQSHMEQQQAVKRGEACGAGT